VESAFEGKGKSAGALRQESCVRNERRRNPRRGVDDSATIRLINMALDVHGRIIDISLGGCRIRTQSRFPVGIYRRVEAEFRIEGLPFRIAGVTQAIHDPFNVGIRFLDMSERKREQLLQLMEEIEEKTALARSKAVVAES
jgi:c-di-GMP-binding flagellar brake protein YcgR